MIALRLATLSALTGATTWLLTGDAAAHTQALCLAATAALLGAMLDPVFDDVPDPPARPPDLRDAAAWALALTAAASFLLAIHAGLAPGRVPALARAGLALGLAPLAFAAGAGGRALLRIGVGPGSARLALVGGWLLLALAPVWLGPLALRTGAPPALVNTTIAIDPLSYLAVLAGADYLRGAWLYAHSPLGSLPHAYPGPLAATLGWLSSAAVALTCARLAVENEWRTTKQ